MMDTCAKNASRRLLSSTNQFAINVGIPSKETCRNVSIVATALLAGLTTNTRDRLALWKDRFKRSYTGTSTPNRNGWNLCLGR